MAVSMHNAICQAVKAVVDDIAPPFDPVVTVVVRKEPIVLEQDTLPLCVISEEGLYRDVEDAFGGSKFREYDVRVTLFRSGKMQLQTDIEDAPDVMATIRDELDGTTLLDVPEVWNVNFSPTATHQPGSVASGADQPALLITFSTNET